MEHCYLIAGSRYRVAGADDILYRDHGVLTPFADCLPEQADYSLFFEIVDQIEPPKGVCLFQEAGKQIYRTEGAVLRYVGTGVAHMRIRRIGGSCTVQCLRTAYPRGITPKTVLNAMEAEHRIVSNGGVVLHASFIRAGGRALLFTAPSGTGKSTQADLWCAWQGAELINGDRVAVMIEEGRVYAYGIPFSGSSGVSKNAKLPVAAIVYLSQDVSNKVEELSGYQAFRKIWEGCTVNVWDKEDVTAAADHVLNIVRSVPVLFFPCIPDQTAVHTLYAYLAERGCL